MEILKRIGVIGTMQLVIDNRFGVLAVGIWFLAGGIWLVVLGD
jgi:hypothetical protein